MCTFEYFSDFYGVIFQKLAGKKGWNQVPLEIPTVFQLCVGVVYLYEGMYTSVHLLVRPVSHLLSLKAAAAFGILTLLSRFAKHIRLFMADV